LLTAPTPSPLLVGADRSCGMVLESLQLRTALEHTPSRPRAAIRGEVVFRAPAQWARSRWGNDLDEVASAHTWQVGIRPMLRSCLEPRGSQRAARRYRWLFVPTRRYSVASPRRGQSSHHQVQRARATAAVPDLRGCIVFTRLLPRFAECKVTRSAPRLIREPTMTRQPLLIARHRFRYALTATPAIGSGACACHVLEVGARE